MALQLIAVDDKSGKNGSPTIYVDKEREEFVFQGWLPGASLIAEIEANPTPDHEPGIPDGEGAVRLPFRMVAAIRKACDAAGLD
ncbi:hypothetical protein [Streptacidiphilus fuscans]|uniref:Uncharacterized protein n=1 Tax=Streptacidiphilus fuscans TaxID=2789292 RepID=A0A931FAI2_9ACTN|nr:hypothetical protein [Streptacidiphilus fuscans]MBF9066423.1 hypothetical protein [Streptacidiphilus fuscans]